MEEEEPRGERPCGRHWTILVSRMDGGRGTRVILDAANLSAHSFGSGGFSNLVLDSPGEPLSMNWTFCGSSFARFVVMLIAKDSITFRRKNML